MTDHSSTASKAGLLPCPFCGGNATHENDSEMSPPYGAYVRCDRCATTSGSSRGREAAITAWNTRSPAFREDAVSDAGALLAQKDARIAELEANIQYLQSRIDSLLFEQCPGEQESAP
jgi:Lar family restriction alleviation protein